MGWDRIIMIPICTEQTREVVSWRSTQTSCGGLSDSPLELPRAKRATGKTQTSAPCKDRPAVQGSYLSVLYGLNRPRFCSAGNLRVVVAAEIPCALKIMADFNVDDVPVVLWLLPLTFPSTI